MYECHNKRRTRKKYSRKVVNKARKKVKAERKQGKSKTESKTESNQEKKKVTLQRLAQGSNMCSLALVAGVSIKDPLNNNPEPLTFKK